MYSHPLDTKEGSLIEPGPWHYGADYIAVYFRADKTALQRVLPKYLKVGEGVCVAYVCEIISVSEKNPGRVYEDPDGTIYGEAALGVGCSYQGKQGVYFPIMWVDKEWSLVRGWLNGYAKRLAKQIVMTKVHPMNTALDPLGIGTSLSGYCVSGGERVLSVRVKIEKRGRATDLANFGSTFGLRRFPSTDASQTKLEELVEVLKYNTRFSDVWSGQGNAKISETYGIGQLRTIQSVYYKAGFSIRGAKVLTSFVSPTLQHNL